MSADFGPLLEAIDFATIAGGVVGAGSALAAVYLAFKFVNLITGFARGDDDAGGHRIRVSKSAPAGWTREDSDRLFAEADAEKGRRRAGF